MMQEKMNNYGFNATSYSIFLPDHPNSDNPNVICEENFKTDWLSEYIDNNYHESDLLVRHCLTRQTAISLDSDNPNDYAKWGKPEMIDGFRQTGMNRVISIPIANSEQELGGIITLGSDQMTSNDFRHTSSNVFGEIFAVASACYAKLENPTKKKNIAKNIDLSPRQYQVLTLLAQGCSNLEISNRLSISEPTVSHHLVALMAKLDVRITREILPEAYRLGLI